MGLACVQPGTAATSICGATHSRTLRENAHVRVYASPNPAGIRRKFDTVACSKASGKRISLDAPELEYYAFIPSAIALSGSIVASADESGCGAEGLCGTAVTARDMRFVSTSREVVNAGFAGPKGHRLVKVGSLRVAPSGALIWIACPERSKARLSGAQHPNCVRRGDLDSVYVLGATRTARLRRLDSGRAIDPRSLSRRDGEATWKHGHSRRSTSFR